MTDQVRVLFFNHRGDMLAEIPCVASRSWLLSRYGQAQISIPISEPKLREVNVQFGNLVLIQNDRLGDWAGVIWPPRTWNTQTCDINAYSAEFIMYGRRSWGGLPMEGAAGSIFEKCVEIAAAVGEIRIEKGQIYQGGPSFSEKPYYERLYDLLVRVSDKSGQEWTLEPKLDSNGRLYFMANWFLQAGTRRDFALIEGVNIMDKGSLLVEQGNISNDITGFGQAATNGARPVYNQTDPTSIARYGVWQDSRSFDVSLLTSLQYYVKVALAKAKYPRRVYSFTANDANNTFDYIGLGDTLPIRLHRTGFYADHKTINGYERVLGIQDTVRIKGRACSETTGEVPLVLFGEEADIE